MKRLFLALLLMLTALFLADAAALAKPKPKPHAAEVQPAQQEEQPAEEAPPPPDTSWKGVVGGWVVAAGADGLAARMGMQPATFGVIAGLLLLAIVVWLIFLLMSSSRRRQRKRRAVYAGDYSNSVSSDRPARAEPKADTARKSEHAQSKERAASAAAKAKSRVDVPEDFDLTKFLRAANALFLRLQTAWDNADLGAIHEFANDEIHEELRLQLRERGEALNKTTVVAFDSKLMKLDAAGKNYTAVVKFSGTIREETQPPKPFMEVWSMTKPKTGSAGWTVTAIQQFI
jgi:predicted lipid-binding transport protein (Tim44 family)